MSGSTKTEVFVVQYIKHHGVVSDRIVQGKRTNWS